jgi:hypothetical protein
MAVLERRRPGWPPGSSRKVAERNVAIMRKVTGSEPAGCCSTYAGKTASKEAVAPQAAIGTSIAERMFHRAVSPRVYAARNLVRTIARARPKAGMSFSSLRPNTSKIVSSSERRTLSGAAKQS